MIEQFKTKKAMKDYYCKIIHEIGLCDSIKTEYPQYYNEFIELFERHPNSKKRLEGITDIQIKKNIQYHNFELYIVTDISCICISYLLCISQKYTKNFGLKAAMRESIQSQITEFKTNTILICEICGSSENPQADHIKHFDELYNEFLSLNTLEVPTRFNDTLANLKVFKEEDFLFCKSWQDYHKQNATLRILCRTCNLSRPKYISPKIEMI
jgi:hypothetical protein